MKNTYTFTEFVFEEKLLQWKNETKNFDNQNILG